MRTLLNALTNIIGIFVLLMGGITVTLLMSIMFIPTLWTGKDDAIKVVNGIKTTWEAIYDSVREIFNKE